MFKKNAVQAESVEQEATTIQVVPYVTVLPAELKYLDRCRMYDIVDYDNGVVKENYGVLVTNQHQHHLMVFDVTTASEEVKEIFGDRIRNFKVKKGLVKKDSTIGQVTSIIPLNGVYQGLSVSDHKLLGDDYCRLTEEDGVTKISPLLYQTRKGNGDIVLRLPKVIKNEELSKKISPEVIDYIKTGENSYIRKDDIVINMDEGMGPL